MNDLISRQVVLDLMIQKWGENFSGDDAMQESIDAIREMPSVTPQEPRKGHWIMTSDYLTTAYGSIDYVKCSCCGEDSLEEGDYCPNCGAKMVEPQESEDKE